MKNIIKIILFIILSFGFSQAKSINEEKIENYIKIYTNAPEQEKDIKRDIILPTFYTAQDYIHYHNVEIMLHPGEKRKNLRLFLSEEKEKELRNKFENIFKNKNNVKKIAKEYVDNIIETIEDDKTGLETDIANNMDFTEKITYFKTIDYCQQSNYPFKICLQYRRMTKSMLENTEINEKINKDDIKNIAYVCSPKLKIVGKNNQNLEVNLKPILVIPKFGFSNENLLFLQKSNIQPKNTKKLEQNVIRYDIDKCKNFESESTGYEYIEEQINNIIQQSEELKALKNKTHFNRESLKKKIEQVKLSIPQQNDPLKTTKKRSEELTIDIEMDIYLTKKGFSAENIRINKRKINQKRNQKIEDKKIVKNRNLEKINKKDLKILTNRNITQFLKIFKGLQKNEKEKSLNEIEQTLEKIILKNQQYLKTKNNHEQRFIVVNMELVNELNEKECEYLELKITYNHAQEKFEILNLNKIKKEEFYKDNKLS